MVFTLFGQIGKNLHREGNLVIKSEYSVAHSAGLVAQWITRLPTEQKIPGSSPGKIASFAFLESLSDDSF